MRDTITIRQVWTVYKCLHRRDLGDGRAVWIYRMIYTHSICIGLIDEPCYQDRWCYHTWNDARAALAAWDPLTQREPSGWHRHPRSGRRRPDGDPSKEYVAL